jgi:hypothetical protein
MRSTHNPVVRYVAKRQYAIGAAALVAILVCVGVCLLAA